MKKRTNKIKNYFNKFCGNDVSRFAYVLFIFKNIFYYWTEKDYIEIIKFIPFKYFTFEKLEKKPNKDYLLGTLEESELHPNNETIKEKSEKNEGIHYLHKISFSMPIVSNALYQFIKDEKNFINFEHYMQTSEKGVAKGLAFKEYIKSNISNKKLEFIKNLKINETLEIWSLFSKTSYSDIPNLFEGKLEKGKVYFIDIRKQTEKFFDCAFIDLIKNQLIFTQITTSKNINHPVFQRKSIKEKSKESIDFLKNNKFIDKDIEFKVGFFFVFLKYDIDKEPDVMDEPTKKLFYYMKNINENLKKMENECKDKNLKYCIYKLSTSFSKEQKNSVISVIEPEDENLFIDLNSIENENVIDKKKFIINRKRKYDEMISSFLNLSEINLENEYTLKLCYEYYTDELNLGKPKIYEDTGKLIYLEELENISDYLCCFVMVKSKNDDGYNLIYYNNSNLKSIAIRKNQFVEEKKKELNEFNGQLYRFFFLGEKEEIESHIIERIKGNTLI